MYIAVAQTNPTVGDLDGNLMKALHLAEDAAEEEADIIVYPAHVLTGVPTGGLGDSDAFLADAYRHLEHLAAQLPIAAILTLGTRCEEADDLVLPEIFVVADGEITSLGYPVLGDETPIVEVNDLNIAVLAEEHFAGDSELAGIDLFVELASDSFPEVMLAPEEEQPLNRMRSVAQTCHAYAAYANLCGASDSMVFAGHSCIFAPDGTCIIHNDLSENAVSVFDTDLCPTPADAASTEINYTAETWEALVVGTHDYVEKSGFRDVVVGLSGGIDSALVATIAVEALGVEHVHGILMPSEYSSEGSLRDANELATTLGIQTSEIPIDEAVKLFHKLLADDCGGSVEGLAAENLQARIRAVYLMTVANANGWLVLNTGNKSEAAMGFSTLYGDTVGALAPIGNLYKTEVYELAKWRVQQGESIPYECLTKPPSAELYEGALDSDRLPDYESLDTILRAHIENDLGLEQIVALGFDEDLVAEVLSTVTKSEYKRRAEPPALQVCGVDLCEDRDWPITCAWLDNS